MKELLRVAMSARQVREACEEWAWQRCGLNAESTSGAVTGVADDCAVQVVFSKKRVRATTKGVSQ